MGCKVTSCYNMNAFCRKLGETGDRSYSSSHHLYFLLFQFLIFHPFSSSHPLYFSIHFRKDILIYWLHFCKLASLFLYSKFWIEFLWLINNLKICRNRFEKCFYSSIYVNDEKQMISICRKWFENVYLYSVKYICIR